MNTSVRFGILSFAHYHANFWAQAVNEHAEATLIGIWDDNIERGLDASRRYQTRFYSDIELLLRECHAVGITSETVKHASLVEAAAAEGVHVLCEKPIATTTEDYERIEHAVLVSGVMFMQNFPKRFDAINRELVEHVRAGHLGEIGLVRIRHGHHHGLDPSFVRQWYADPSLSGGGTLIDEGVHAADFLNWLLGPPSTAHAATSKALLKLRVEDTAAATFTFPGGTIAEVATSWSFLAADQSIEIYGTGGTALLGGVDLASRGLATLPYLRLFRAESAERVWTGSAEVPGFISGGFHEQGPRRFIESILAGECSGPGLEEGRVSLEMILAAYRAARNGQVETV